MATPIGRPRTSACLPPEGTLYRRHGVAHRGDSSATCLLPRASLAAPAGVRTKSHHLHCKNLPGDPARGALLPHARRGRPASASRGHDGHRGCFATPACRRPNDVTVLADTSVWIEYLRRGKGSKSARLDDLLVAGEVLVCGPVVTELLAGAKSPDRGRLWLQLTPLCQPPVRQMEQPIR